MSQQRKQPDSRLKLAAPVSICGSLVAVSALAALLAGCSQSDQQPKPLTPHTFYPRSQTENSSPMVEDPETEMQRSHPATGVRIPLNPNLPPPDSGKQQEPVIPPPVPATGSSAPVDPPPIAATPTTNPIIGNTSGQFLYLGTIVAEVNDTPIYANKVLAMLEKPFHAKARTLNRADFRDFAMDQIKRQIDEMIFTELEFATADRMLEDEDKGMCKQYTEKWRREQIIAAGGSLELARKRAAADDSDFEELVKEQYRNTLIDLYRERKIYPKVQISAQDMRDFYDKNRDTMFTEHDAALFLLIKIDTAHVGSREQTFAKAKEVLQRAHNGEDFAVLARTENNDDSLRARSGLVGSEPIHRHAFWNSKIEDAVWNTPEGQVTDLIDDGTAFYIARVEKLTHGHVIPFEALGDKGSPGTQELIRKKLRDQQIHVLHQHDLENMKRAGFFHIDEAGAQVTLDMAMQKYPIWAAGK